MFLNVGLHLVAAVKQILNPTVKLFPGDPDMPREIHTCEPLQAFFRGVHILAAHIVRFALLATRLAAEIDGTDDAGPV